MDPLLSEKEEVGETRASPWGTKEEVKIQRSKKELLKDTTEVHIAQER